MSLKAAKGMLRWCDALKVKPVPLRADTNQPFHSQWGLRDYEAPELLNDHGHLFNIGWLLGPRSDWLCDIDIDTDKPEDIYEIQGIYEDIGAVPVGYNGRVSHYLFRLAGRPEFDENVGYSVVFDHKRENGKVAGMEWLLGGQRLDGTPKQKQVRVWGNHQSGHRLEFLHGKPKTADDIPVVDWQQANELWEVIVARLGGSTRKNAGGKGTEQNYGVAVREAASIDVGWTMPECLSLLYGIAAKAGVSSQRCPACQRKALMVHTDSAYCYHENSCPTKLWCDGGGFHVGHLVAFNLGLDWEDWQQSEAAMWWARRFADGEEQPKDALAVSLEQRAQPWSPLLDVGALQAEIDEWVANGD